MRQIHQDLGIFGIGSAHGIDALGGAALEYLRPRLAAHPAAGRLRWQVSRTPADMLPRWEGLARVLLLDALPLPDHRSPLCRLTPAELEAGGALSSHGLGIGEVIELAAALGRGPQLSILGLVIDPAGSPSSGEWLAQHGSVLTQAVSAWLGEAY